MEKPDNTKMLGVWNREKFIAGPCKEVGDSCLKTPKLPKSKSCSVVSQLFVTPWAVAHQAPLSMEFSMPEYWGGLPFHSPCQNTGVGCHSILHARILEWVAIPFSMPEYWGGLPFHSPGDLSNLGTKLSCPILQTDSLPADLSGKLPKSFQQSPFIGKVREAQR